MIRYSIAIPFYKGMATIDATLDSVCRQSVSAESVEILVVDDGCDGDVEKRIRQHGERVQYHKNAHNLGLVGNWNKCISLCRGKYVLLLHSDDLISPSFLEEVGAGLDESGAALGVCRSVVINSTGEVVGRQKSVFPNEGLVVNAFHELLKGNKIFTPCALVRRSAYESWGVFDERFRLYPDYEMWLRVARHSSVYFINKELASWRRHNQNTTLAVLRGGLDIHEGLLLVDELMREGYIDAKKYRQMRRHMLREHALKTMALMAGGDLDGARERLSIMGECYDMRTSCKWLAAIAGMPGAVRIVGSVTNVVRPSGWAAELWRRRRAEMQRRERA